MPPRNKKTNRKYFVILSLAFVIGVVGIISQNFRDNIVFYYTVSELDFSKMNNKKIRIGGLVEKGSVSYSENGFLYFVITDKKERISVSYQGIVPDLFREEQGVVVEGFLQKGKDVFEASTVLAKHDENYTPPRIEQ